MGLDKLKKKKKPHQLVSRRKDNKRPGYRGRTDADTMSGSGYGAGSSSSSSSSSDDNRENYISQQYTAPAPTPEPDTSGDDQEEDVATMMETLGITPDNAPTGFTPTTGEDVLGEGDYDDGRSLYTSPTQTMKDEEPYIDYKPGPNYVTAEELSNLERGLGDADEQAATLAKIQAINPIQKTGFFDSGIGSVLKTAGKIAAPILAPALLPTQLAKGYTTYNQVRNLSRTADFLTRGKYNLAMPSFTQLVKNAPKNSIVTPTGFTPGGEGDNNDRVIPKNVIATNVQKFSPQQMNRAITLRDQLQSYAETGRLNEKGMQTLTGLNQLIEEYQVSV